MTKTFLPGDRISIEGTVIEVIHEGSQRPSTTRIAVDGWRVPGLVNTTRLTWVERPVVLPTNPHDYLPDPVTGQPRWEMNLGGERWWEVKGIKVEGGVWRLTGIGWSSPIGSHPVRPVADQLPPFDAAAACPKCGHDIIGTLYTPNALVWKICEGHLPEGTDRSTFQHLHRMCRRCPCVWAEAVTGATP
jgi:hypothetical protein